MVVLALALLALAGCGDEDSPSEFQTKRQAGDAGDAAKRFLDRYVAADGRVRRIDQDDDTVGEGQAYGMLIAAASGDSAHFDSIWKWTKDNIRRPDGLISFLWKDGKVQDPQAASDADVDAVRALLVAGCRFNRPGYRDEALSLAKAILRHETAEPGGDVLVAGPWATKEPQTINPSYFSPATFAALARVTGDRQWDSLATTSRSITGALMTSSTPLPPDWAKLEGDRAVATGPPNDTSAKPSFGFDAPRTLDRFAEDPDPAGRKIAARAWPVFKDKDPDKVPVEHDVSGNVTGKSLHPIVLVAAAGAADAAGDTAGRDQYLDAADDMDRRSPTYYGAAWVAIGRYMLTTDKLDVCS